MVQNWVVLMVQNSVEWKEARLAEQTVCWKVDWKANQRAEHSVGRWVNMKVVESVLMTVVPMVERKGSLWAVH